MYLWLYFMDNNIFLETKRIFCVMIEYLRMRKQMEEEIRAQFMANQQMLADSEVAENWDQKVSTCIVWTFEVCYYRFIYLVLIIAHLLCVMQ